MSQYWGMNGWTGHHPILSTWLQGTLTCLGSMIWDMNLGVFLFVLIQTILAVVLFTKMIHIYALEKMSKWAQIFVFLFFALTPVWPSFIQTMGKDIPFMLIVAGFTMWLYHNQDVEVEWHLKSWKSVRFIFLCMGVVYLRNNGWHLVVFTLIAMVIVMKEKRKTIFTITVVVIVLTTLINNGLFSILQIEKGSIRETLSIPFQQTARYVREYGDEIPEEERQAIDAVLDYDSIGENYLPFLSDPVKGTYREGTKEELAAYFKVWVKQLLRHPMVYVDATLSGTYTYLSPGSKWLWGYNYFTVEDNDFGIHHVGNEEPIEQIAMIDRELSVTPVIHYLYAPGTYVWLLMFFCVYNFYKCQGRRNLMMVPSFVLVLTCIASPCLGCVRYILPLMASMPMIGLTCFKSE
ncbi:MAG: DUF6020 family protein [Lachnospiraceae bacterium]|nr:DUF6020 family protein [Lachnospiraceae bacterium]